MEIWHSRSVNTCFVDGKGGTRITWPATKASTTSYAHCLVPPPLYTFYPYSANSFWNVKDQLPQQKKKKKVWFKRPTLMQLHSLNIVHQMGEREHKPKTLCSMHCDCFAVKCPCFKSGSCSPTQKSCLLLGFGLTFHCTQTFVTL